MRNGQVYIVVNRIEEIPEKKEFLLSIVGDLKLEILHGKLPPKKLTESFEKFYKGECEAVLTTALIENGIDLPRANTLIVLDAHRYGLADLYQLRGRVGRSHLKGYAYFMFPKEEILTEGAKNRLEAIKNFTHLGSGFHLALRDLEIRGAGEILGKKQWGHSRYLGFTTTLRILEEVSREWKGEPIVDLPEPEVRGDLPQALSSQYIPDPHERLKWYYHLSSARDEEEAERKVEEIIDLWGNPPTEQDQEFLEFMKIQPLLRTLWVRTLLADGNRILLSLHPSSPIDRTALVEICSTKKEIRLHPEKIEIVLNSRKERWNWLKEFLYQISPFSIRREKTPS
jgi:transcription-repair coupling factor (superfamily II helicase)